MKKPLRNLIITIASIITAFTLVLTNPNAYPLTLFTYILPLIALTNQAYHASKNKTIQPRSVKQPSEVYT